MSGVAFELRVDGAPAIDAVNAMLGRMRHRAIDGRGTWTDGPVCLGLAAAWYTPEDVGTTAPLIGQRGRVVAFDGRLDDRRDLARTLGVDDAGPDAALVLAALDKWGDDVATRLVGDFAFVCWDPVRRRALLARDRVGQRPLFYGAHARGVRAASEIQALFADGALAPRPDEDQLALALSEDYSESGSTLLAGVRAVPPGHVVLVEHGRATERRYWDPAEPRDGPRTHEDAVLALDAALSGAVRARLRSRTGVAVAVSGGVDSSLVAALAAENARAMGSPPPRLVTARFPGLGCDEGVFTGRLARHLSLSLDAVVADELDVPARWMPPPHLDLQLDPFNNLYAAMGRVARAGGANVVLDGWGSDELQWCTGLEIDDAARARDWAEVARRAGLFETPWSARGVRRAAGAGLRALAPRTWGAVSRSRQRPDAVPDWLTEDATQRIRALRSARAARFDSLRSASPAQAVIVMGLVDSAQSQFGVGQRMLAAAVEGFEQREPFFDARVVELLLATPSLLRTDAVAGKPLTRAIAGRRLPASISHRVHPATEFSPFFRATGLAAAQRLERAGWSSVLSSFGLVDWARVRGLQRRDPDGFQLRELLCFLALEEWARQWFPDAGPAQLQP